MAISNISGLGKLDNEEKGNKIYNYGIRDAGQRGFEGFYSCYLSFYSAVDFIPSYYSSFIENYVTFLQNKGEYSSVELYYTPCNGQLTTGTIEGNSVHITNVDEINEFSLYRDISNDRWLLSLYQYQPQIIGTGHDVYSNRVQIATIEPSFIDKFIQGV